MIQIGLRFFQTLEPHSFQRCSLLTYDFAFAVRILDPARHGDGTIVGQQIAVKRIDRGIVNVGDQYPLPQVVEHDRSGRAT